MTIPHGGPVTGPADRHDLTGLATTLLRELRERDWWVGVAESLTGGLVASAIIEIAGASSSIRGGVVAYDTAVKRSLLGVDGELLAERGAVDADVAEQMARGVRRALAVDGRATDMGIATTGVAGPEPQDGTPVGTVFVAVSTPDGEVSRAHAFEGGRAEIRRQSVVAALDLACEILRPRER